MLRNINNLPNYLNDLQKAFEKDYILVIIVSFNKLFLLPRKVISKNYLLAFMYVPRKNSPDDGTLSE